MDSAFNDAVYPAYSTTELRAKIAAGNNNPKMIAEIARRDAVAAGDASLMTAGERLNRASESRA